MSGLTIEKRYRVEVGTLDRGVDVWLVGCGGTGSFVALHLARLAWHLRERHGITMGLTFIDPDVVEAKNIGRQNFCPAEVGMHKAETLARRYSAAFGLRIRIVTEKFDADAVTVNTQMKLIVGCVDNAAARREIDRLCQWHSRDGFWWLDAGNHEHSGQVLIGNATHPRPLISPLGFCSFLPWPSLVHPELLEDEPAGERASEPGGESCAELALREAQSLMVNQMMAAWMANYLARLFVSRDLDMRATYVDLTTGSARSIAITQDMED